MTSSAHAIPAVVGLVGGGGGGEEEEDGDEEEVTKSPQGFAKQLQRQRQQVLNGETSNISSFKLDFSQVLRQRQQQVLRGNGSVGDTSSAGGGRRVHDALFSPNTEATDPDFLPSMITAIGNNDILSKGSTSFDTAEFEADLLQQQQQQQNDHPTDMAQQPSPQQQGMTLEDLLFLDTTGDDGNSFDRDSEIGTGTIDDNVTDDLDALLRLDTNNSTMMTTEDDNHAENKTLPNGESFDTMQSVATPIQNNGIFKTVPTEMDPFGDFTSPPEANAISVPVGNGFHIHEVKSQNDDYDDFGDFDEAPAGIVPSSSGGETSAPVNVDGEDFGDFSDVVAPAPLPAETLQDPMDAFGGLTSPTAETTDIQSPFDDFGDFGTGQSIPVVMTNASYQTPHDMNGFEGFAPVSKSSESGDPPTVDPSPVPVDLFGDFDAAPVIPTAQSMIPEENGFGTFMTPPLALSAESDLMEHNGDDDFGDFDEAPAVLPPPTTGESFDANLEKTSVDSSDIVTSLSFDKQQETPSNPVEDMGPPSGLALDGFGEFGSAPSHSTESKDVQPLDPSPVDLFGDFDAAPAVSTTSSAILQENGNGAGPEFSTGPDLMEHSPNSNDDDDNDDFGDFGEAPAILPPSTTSESFVPAIEDKFVDSSSVVATINPLDDVGPPPDPDDDDDFGDFGGAPAIPTTPTNGSQDIDDDGGFGNFAGIPDAIENTTEPTLDQPEDDDFGDFEAADISPVLEQNGNKGTGEFVGAPENPLTASPAQEQKQENFQDDFDDFGDFDEAPVVPPSQATETVESNTDDDFGDFGDFGSAPQVAQNEDEEFGDFGETSSPPEDSHVTADETKDSGHDDFGDFGEFEEGEAVESASGVHAKVPVTLVDQSNLNAMKLVMSRFQTKYPFESVDGSDEPATSPVVSLTSILSKLVEEEKQDNLKDFVSASMLKFVVEQNRSGEEEEAERTVIKDDGRGPFFQFSFPVEGLPRSIEDIEQPGARRIPVYPAIVPELPPMYMGSKPLSVPSPTSKSGNSESSFRSKGPRFPVLDSSKVALPSSTAPSPQVKKVLDKITDLSFMLQSKLTLPK